VIGDVTDRGDGTYDAWLTTPSLPGVDRVSVRISTTAGVATLADAVFVVYLGPVDAARSTLTASPRRIDADGVAQTTLALVPRDGSGEWLGPGRDVSFGVTGTPGSTLSPAVDLGDVYAASLRAASESGFVDVTASVNGVPVGRTLQVPFGFDLLGVLTQARIDVDTSLAVPGVKSSRRRLLRAALRHTEKALPLAEGGPGAADERRALARTRTSCVKFAKATRASNGAAPDLGTAGELARAIRDAASDAVSRAVITSGRDQKQVDRARARLADGQSLYDLDKPRRAAKTWLAAFDLVRKLASR
jgi:hypothetical protein